MVRLQLLPIETDLTQAISYCQFFNCSSSACVCQDNSLHKTYDLLKITYSCEGQTLRREFLLQYVRECFDRHRAKGFDGGAN